MEVRVGLDQFDVLRMTHWQSQHASYAASYGCLLQMLLFVTYAEVQL